MSGAPALEVRETDIPDVKVLVPRRLGDARGFLSETYSRRTFEAAGFGGELVQENHSLSAPAGTVRGLHFQRPPFAQDKLVRVLRGRVLDVAVDLREGSPTLGRHVSVELDARGFEQVWVPVGFAHGFCTLEPDTEVLYKVSRYYSPEHEGGVLWNDPELGIEWPVEEADATLSERDRRLPRLAELDFRFGRAGPGSPA